MLAKTIAFVLKWLVTIAGFAGATALVSIAVMAGFVTVGIVFELSLPYLPISGIVVLVSFAVLVSLVAFKKYRDSQVVKLWMQRQSPEVETGENQQVSSI